MSKKSEEKIIKETKYCKIISQGKVGEGEYTYSIEKIYIKELKRDEVRFCVYKATRRGDETYIPRSLDVTELELIELIKESIIYKIYQKYGWEELCIGAIIPMFNNSGVIIGKLLRKNKKTSLNTDAESRTISK